MEWKWNGKYWYLGKLPENFKEKLVRFELNILELKNGKIHGTVADNLEDGGTNGIGSFMGMVKGNSISFVKKMPMRSYFFKDGSRFEENKPHASVYYKGIMDIKNNTVKGTWKIKMRFGILNGRVAFFPGTKGEWDMVKDEGV